MPGEEAFQAACELGVEGIVSKRLMAPYKSGQCKSWIKVRNPKSSAYLRISTAAFSRSTFDELHVEDVQLRKWIASGTSQAPRPFD
jgi:ATP-dependent DNA ligase